MSRSGYSDSDNYWGMIRWRGAVASSLKGARGQSFLRELRDAMDAMPTKQLIRGELEADGCMCALGVVGAARGLDMSRLDTYDREGVANAFGIADAMAAEVMFMNDEGVDAETDADRWQQMRLWVEEQIIAEINQERTV